MALDSTPAFDQPTRVISEDCTCGTHDCAIPNGVTLVKFVGDAYDKLDVLACPYYGDYNGRDSHREYFSPNTKFHEGAGIATVPALYAHAIVGMRSAPQHKQETDTLPVGYAERGYRDKDGYWYTVTLSKGHPRYTELVDAAMGGYLYASSTTMADLVKVSGEGEILDWCVVALSLLPYDGNVPARRPANMLAKAMPRQEYKARAVSELKQLLLDGDSEVKIYGNGSKQLPSNPATLVESDEPATSGNITETVATGNITNAVLNAILNMMSASVPAAPMTNEVSPASTAKSACCASCAAHDEQASAPKQKEGNMTDREKELEAQIAQMKAENELARQQNASLIKAQEDMYVGTLKQHLCTACNQQTGTALSALADYRSHLPAEVKAAFDTALKQLHQVVASSNSITAPMSSGFGLMNQPQMPSMQMPSMQMPQGYGTQAFAPSPMDSNQYKQAGQAPATSDYINHDQYTQTVGTFTDPRTLVEKRGA